MVGRRLCILTRNKVSGGLCTQLHCAPSHHVDVGVF